MNKQTNEIRMAARQFAVELTEEEMKEFSGGLLGGTGTNCRIHSDGTVCCDDPDA